jgi:plasmid stability protein
MEFDRSIARYFDNGRSLAREVIRLEAQRHANSIGAELRALTETALNESWEVPRFESAFGRKLKDAYIRLAVLGKGGKIGREHV